MHGDPLPPPGWWTGPGETDTLAWAALIFIGLLVFGVLHLYARFDRYAEHKAMETPLRTTIPTLLVVALAYELFPPISHFSVLLPIALILGALARDLMLWLKLPATPDQPDAPTTDVETPASPIAAGVSVTAPEHETVAAPSVKDSRE